MKNVIFHIIGGEDAKDGEFPHMVYFLLFYIFWVCVVDQPNYPQRYKRCEMDLTYSRLLEAIRQQSPCTF